MAPLTTAVFAQTPGETDPACAPVGTNSYLSIVDVASEQDFEADHQEAIPFESVPSSPEVSYSGSPNPRSKDDLNLFREWLATIGPVDGMRILVGRTIGVRFESRVESVDWKFAIEYERTLPELKGAIRYKF